MKLNTCPKGHFYDADKYASCPYCVPQDEAEAVTEAVKTEDFSQPAAVKAQEISPSPVPVSKLNKPASFVNTAVNGWEEPEDDENCTVGYYAQVIGVEPVVGWLVCINGAYRGESFKLKSGRNFIGRAANMDIVLGADQSVSRLHHAAVVYDPKSRAFIVAAGDARELCYLNGDVVVTSQRLQAYDVLTLGNTELMLIPLCGEKFSWDDTTENGVKA
ncbi:MAG: FHA domain-containing protein [Oliverpabstia intestinalis]|nr:FHA domain-containing protein [Oliverpabstia intestinalis]MDD6410779.1 FHA domain-containing protein [Oliverpabstia intestinalis]